MKEVPVIYKKNEPVIFGEYRVPYFPYEKSYEDMDYADMKYRLLGLFRFWNAVEYYYPYLDILDDNWNIMLKKHIPMMVEETDKQSYELAIASLSIKMHDAHVSLIDPEAYVTIIGQNSVGANGPVTYIALPGGNFIQFTSRAIYTPEGGQTQRIGLTPDIYVERTIAGIRDGRDEFIERQSNLYLIIIRVFYYIYGTHGS